MLNPKRKLNFVLFIAKMFAENDQAMRYITSKYSRNEEECRKAFQKHGKELDTLYFRALRPKTRINIEKSLSVLHTLSETEIRKLVEKYFAPYTSKVRRHQKFDSYLRAIKLPINTFARVDNALVVFLLEKQHMGDDIEACMTEDARELYSAMLVYQSAKRTNRPDSLDGHAKSMVRAMREDSYWDVARRTNHDMEYDFIACLLELSGLTVATLESIRLTESDRLDIVSAGMEIYQDAIQENFDQQPDIEPDAEEEDLLKPYDAMDKLFAPSGKVKRAGFEKNEQILHDFVFWGQTVKRLSLLFGEYREIALAKERSRARSQRSLAEEKLSKELEALKLQLQQEQKKSAALQERLNEQQLKIDKCSLEIADKNHRLREQAELLAALEKFEDKAVDLENTDEADIPEIPDGAVLFGGHPRWQKFFAQKHPEVKIISPKDVNFPLNIIDKAPCILLNTHHMSHAQYYRFMPVIKRLEKKVLYVK